jgi:hypothetical protein
MIPWLKSADAVAQHSPVASGIECTWDVRRKHDQKMRFAAFPSLELTFRLSVVLTLLCAFVRCSSAESASTSCLNKNDAKKNEKNEPKTDVRRLPEQEALLAVRRLGDSNWRIRDQAEQTLEELGVEALPAINAALNDPDAEIHARVFALRIRLLGRGFLGISMDEREEKGARAENDAEEAEAEDAELKTLEPCRPLRPQPRPEVVVVAGAANAPDISPRWPKDKKMPAEIAGIQPGDHILSVNGFRLGGASDLIYRVVEAGPGASVLLKIKRGDEELLAAAVLTRNPLDVPKLHVTPLDFRSRPEPLSDIPEPPASPSK